MKTVIIMNGPPGVGKDTLTDIMVDRISAIKNEFKKALYKETAKYYNFDLDLFIYLATSREYKDNLKSPFSIHTGMTPRKALIYVSENVIKPLHGNGYFGERAADNLEEGINVFSDGGGWYDELLPVIKEADNTVIFRLHREGFTFEGDSRHYYSDNIPESVKDKIKIVDIQLQEENTEEAIKCILSCIQ